MRIDEITNEGTEPSYYTSYVIDKASRRTLLKAFPPKYNLVGHHVTVEFGMSADSALPDPAKIKVIGYADDGSLEALLVEINGTTKRSDGKTYHLTWSKTKDRRSVESNQVIGMAQHIEPIEIDGVPTLSEIKPTAES